MHHLSRRTALAGLLGTAGAALVACSSEPQPSAPTTAPPVSATPTPTPSPTVDDRPRWPLSGRLLGNAKDAAHAAVAVKVPDTRGEHPHRGLEAADIVFVELDGYRDTAGFSSTRLLPVFHSKLPEAVGPVRSIRPVDVPLLSPMHALIGNTGAVGWVLAYVQQHASTVEGMLSYMNTKGTGSYSIDPSRVRVLGGTTYYDRATVCHPKVLARQTKRFREGPTQVYFPFGDADAASTADGRTVSSVRVPWKAPGTYDMTYTWDDDSGTWLRSMPWGPHVTSDGKRIAPVNVLVIRAKHRYAKLASGQGRAEPVHDIIEATGPFHYFHGGRMVTGTWRKAGVAEPFRFTLEGGAPLVMAPGQTFVELPNSTAKIVIKG